MSIVLTEDMNYGVIISSDKEEKQDYNIEPYVYNGIQYIYYNLIKPLQTNILTGFKDIKAREITSIKSRSDQLKRDKTIYNKIIKEKEKQEYQSIAAIKMTDFDEFIEDINPPDEEYYDNTNEFKILVENDTYLLKMFKLLQHINKYGIYYYNNEHIKTDLEKSIPSILKSLLINSVISLPQPHPISNILLPFRFLTNLSICLFQL